MLLRMGTEEWGKYYSKGTTSTPTDRIPTAGPFSGAQCAAENVPEGLAKVLLEGDDLNTDKQDNRGQN